jgi:hypothetical protein
MGTFQQFEFRRYGAFPKQALARTERDGEYFQAKFVNQVILQKSLEKIAAAVDLYFGAALPLQLLDFPGGLSRRKPTSIPKAFW